MLPTRADTLSNRNVHDTQSSGSLQVYFADMVSKVDSPQPPPLPPTAILHRPLFTNPDLVCVCTQSANYCMATSDNSTAVLLLCDVALGEPYELVGAEYEAKVIWLHFQTAMLEGIKRPLPPACNRKRAQRKANTPHLALARRAQRLLARDRSQVASMFPWGLLAQTST